MQNQFAVKLVRIILMMKSGSAMFCEQNLDEDEYVRLVEGHYRSCPYYRDGDCYKIARKQ